MTINAKTEPMPGYVTDEMIDTWDKNGFSLHFIPYLDLLKDEEFSQISKSNKELLEKTLPDTKSYICPDRWLLIERRNLCRTKLPWISSQDSYLFTLLGIKTQQLLQKYTKTPKVPDFLDDILLKHNQHSRFCLTTPVITSLLPDIRMLLKLPDTCIVRLPHYVEYCYLSKNFYPEWNTTKTWEWLEDTKNDHQHLATGYKTWNIIGSDPTKFWSTILGFRLVIEL